MCLYRTHCVPLSWMRVFSLLLSLLYIPGWLFSFSSRTILPGCPPLRKKLGHFFPAGVVFIRSEWRRWRVGKRKGRPLLSILAGGSALSSDSVRCVAARSFAPRLAHSRCAYAPHRRTAQAAATSPPGLCRRGEIGPVVLCCSQPPVVSSDSHGCAPRCLSACALLPARALRLVVRSSRREL